MTQSVQSRSGSPIDAASIPSAEWEVLKQNSELGDFVMPCCDSPAVLKTSINGLQFFAHLTDECTTASETVWHKTGKLAVMAGLVGLGINGVQEVTGQSPSGRAWRADVMFSIHGRNVAIELQRSYQHLREFVRRQELYVESNVECYWLTPKEHFMTLSKATARLLLKRDYGNVFPLTGLGTGSLPELPVSVLDTESEQLVQFGGMKSAPCRLGWPALLTRRLVTVKVFGILVRGRAV